MWHNNITELIGNTPLVRLNRITKGIKATVLVKLEFFNPAGSVKDRMAFHALKAAKAKGKLKPGSTIVENTSGNTGTGVALYGIMNKHKTIFTIPDKMSKSKINLMKAYGAEVVVCPTAVPYDSPESYYEVANRITRETPNAFKLDQFYNKDNMEAHYKSTGPEIWEQTEHKVTCVVAGAGTGGTISGIGRFLKEKNPKIKIIAVDPVGSIFYDYFKTQKIVESKTYLVEGIGDDMLSKNLDFSVIDDMIQVTDKDAFLAARKLLREEGVFAGGSSGAALWGALTAAKKLSKNNLVVTILPDSGYNYLEKVFNDDWMREKGFI